MSDTIFEATAGDRVWLIIDVRGLEGLDVGLAGIAAEESAEALLANRVRFHGTGRAEITYDLGTAVSTRFAYLQFDVVALAASCKAFKVRISLRSDGRTPQTTDIGVYEGTAPETAITGELRPISLPVFRASLRGSPRAGEEDGRTIERSAAPSDQASPATSTPKRRQPHPALHLRDEPRPAGAGASDAVEPASVDSDRTYPVWYATNRAPHVKEARNRGYTADRDTTGAVHLGRCTVRIPEAHRIGEIGSSWWHRLVTGTDDRLNLVRIDPLGSEEFWTGIAKQLGEADVGRRHAVVFIHGYNVSFSDAALRTAQMGCDLGIDGAMAFYSWPSRGTLTGYWADEATVEASYQKVATFLSEVASRSGAEKVHVIAHSMGNRALLDTVRTTAATAESCGAVPFSQFILAAPDVDAEYFREFASGYAALSSRTTMYVSDSDEAIRASLAVHGGAPRVGLVPPVQVVPGIDTVYAGYVDRSFLGHGYVAEAWQLLRDIHDLIYHDTPPKQRQWIRAAASGAHWRLTGVTA